MPDPALAAAHDAYARHDWDSCLGLALAASTTDDRAEAERQVLLAESAWWTGRLEECIEHRQAAYQLSAALGDTRAAGVAAVWLYEHHCLRARPSVGTAWLQRARRLLGLRGDLADAEKEATRGCAELIDGHLPNVAAGWAEVGDIRRRLGDFDGAEEAFARAAELRGRPCWGTALLRLDQGRVDEASRIIEGCVADQSASRLARARVLPAAVQISIASSDLLTAEEYVDELEQIADAFDIALLRASAQLARGRLLLAEGEPRTAAAVLHDALRWWQDLRVPYEEATTRTVLAQAQRDAGDDAGARESFAAARAQFDAIGAHLTAAGVDTVEQRSPRPGGLTEREVEVLVLVAQGWSNKEIASELTLSIKTVSRHLSNIFTKIGVSTRSGATAYAFRHGLIGSSA